MNRQRARTRRGEPGARFVAGGLIVGSVLALTVSCSSGGTSGGTGPSTGPSASASRASSGASNTPSVGASASSTAPPKNYRAVLTRTIKRDGGAGTVSVAAVNLSTGAHVQGGGTHGQWIASMYKLLLVESLLLKNNGELSDSERSDAALALENSDNAAGYRLYLDVGGQAGMLEQLRALGVKHFDPGVSDPTLSTTGAPDLVQVLRALVEPKPLSSSSRDYVLGLLRNVETDQRWGVGAAATHKNFVNKNGWLSIDNSNPAGETDNGLWAVNSMGIVVAHGQKVLMAVMTQHNDDFAGGITRVETLAKAAGRVVAS